MANWIGVLEQAPWKEADGHLHCSQREKTMLLPPPGSLGEIKLNAACLKRNFSRTQPMCASA